tara:strand:- start:92 stop:688 length:597 start_codon:yes stop_codon:yes gene_type:complete
MSRRPSELGGPPPEDRLKAVLAAGLAQRKTAVVSGAFFTGPRGQEAKDKKALAAGFRDDDTRLQFLEDYLDAVDLLFSADTAAMDVRNASLVKERPSGVTNELLKRNMTALSKIPGFVRTVNEYMLVFGFESNKGIAVKKHLDKQREAIINASMFGYIGADTGNRRLAWNMLNKILRVLPRNKLPPLLATLFPRTVRK